MEQLFLLCRVGSSSFVVGGVYIPPQSEFDLYEKHCHTVDILRQEYSTCNFYIFGDFNLPDASWGSDDSGVVVGWWLNAH